MLKVDFRVAAPAWRPLFKAHKVDFGAAVTAACAAVVLPAHTYVVAVSLVDDAEIRALNATYRQQDKPTNVLSFPQHDEWDAISLLPPPVTLGDIVLGYETIVAEAAAQGKSPADHVRHLLVHGFLHLLGYDHLTDEDAAEMEDLETGILHGLGVADPYLMD